jgi:hypothetical protein
MGEPPVPDGVWNRSNYWVDVIFRQEVNPLTRNLRNEVRKPYDGFRCGRERVIFRDFSVLQQ